MTLQNETCQRSPEERQEFRRSIVYEKESSGEMVGTLAGILMLYNEIANETNSLEASEKLMENDAKELTRHGENIESILLSYIPHVEKEMKLKLVSTDSRLS